jgi:hypothetical protein
MPLQPHSEGMVERYIETVEEHLRQTVESHQRDWDARLPIFVLAYRATSHGTIDLTSVGLFFGKVVRLP